MSADHVIHTASLFIWTQSGFAIEVNVREFLDEICREFGLEQMKVLPLVEAKFGI